MPSGKTPLFLNFFIELASIIEETNDDVKLRARIRSLIDEHRCYPFTDEDIEKAILSNDGAHLFFIYKNTPSKVKNFSFIENLLRKMWLYNVIGYYYRAITMDDISKTVEKKYNDEKSFNQDLVYKLFCLFDDCKKYRNDRYLHDLGVFYAQYLNYFELVYKNFEHFFEGYEEKAYLKFLYNCESAKNEPIISNREKLEIKKKKPYVALLTNEQIEQLVEENEELRQQIIDLTSENKGLNDIIETLNFEKRNLDVKINYAKKDITRELLCALSNPSWNNPLGELYLQSLRNDMDEKTIGIITNLFNCLSEIGVKLVREKEIGKEIVITKENQFMFDPMKNEDIYLDDKATIVYPGYRYKNETMVRPIIKKIKEEK